MDAIEISRQTAERLHLEAVKRGCDPWRPYAFVLAEAVRRDLVVEKARSGTFDSMVVARPLIQTLS